jgi:L-alanine-DL-glutamate epimerase-like enolase superfamily enzyme
VSTIASVSVSIVRIPLDHVTSFATRDVAARDYCLVKISAADNEAQGIGFCYVGHSAGNIAKVIVEELLAPKLIGQESTRVEGLWEDMYLEALLHGRSGSTMRAISALDIALWDMNSRSAGLPLYSYLGCWTNAAVPAYASGGYYLNAKTPEHLGEEMTGYVREGFKAVKMKVGRLAPAEDEVRVCTAREAIGPDCLLMLDANNAWRDLPTALLYCRRFEKYNPYWIEEPFSPDDIENHAKLAERTDISVATGEIEVGRWRFRELLEKKGAEIVQPDAAVCGGISEWRRIAQTAASYGVTVSPHWFDHLHIHLVASAPNARYVEYFPNDKVFNFRKLLDGRLHVKNGSLLLPQSPGLGFKFDERAVAAHALDPGQVWTPVT